MLFLCRGHVVAFNDAVPSAAKRKTHVTACDVAVTRQR